MTSEIDRKTAVASQTRPSSEIAQTLDRGIQVMEVLASRSSGMTIAQIASDIGVGRTIARRLVNTLQARRLVSGPTNGTYRLGPALLEMSRQVRNTLAATAEDVLVQLSQDTGYTSHLSIREGEDAIALATVKAPNATHSIAWSPGSRHPVRLGAGGIALMSLRPPTPFDPEAVTECRRFGYALSRAELNEETVGVAAPVPTETWDFDVALGIVGRHSIDEEKAVAAVKKAARDLRYRLDHQ